MTVRRPGGYDGAGPGWRTVTGMTDTQMRCRGCGLGPADIPEYVSMAINEGYATADAFVRQEEGTFNQASGLFWCTDCYIQAGCPTGVA